MDPETKKEPTGLERDYSSRRVLGWRRPAEKVENYSVADEIDHFATRINMFRGCYISIDTRIVLRTGSSRNRSFSYFS